MSCHHWKERSAAAITGHRSARTRLDIPTLRRTPRPCSSHCCPLASDNLKSHLKDCVGCLATSAQKHVAGSTALVRREAVDPKSKYAGLTKDQNEKIEKDQIFINFHVAMHGSCQKSLRWSGALAPLHGSAWAEGLESHPALASWVETLDQDFNDPKDIHPMGSMSLERWICDDLWHRHVRTLWAWNHLPTVPKIHLRMSNESARTATPFWGCSLPVNFLLLQLLRRVWDARPRY